MKKKNSTDSSSKNQIECQAQKFAIFVTLKSEMHVIAIRVKSQTIYKP